MIETNELQTVKTIIKDFFQKTGFEIEIVSLNEQVTPSQEGSDAEISIVSVGVRTDEPRVLIGERGQVLIEIQHLLRTILRKKTDKQFLLELDINDYKKKKAEYLKELARLSAEEVVLSKQERVLPPMSAYERRLVHMELSSNQNVVTESIGEYLDRRIVIKPRISF